MGDVIKFRAARKKLDRQKKEAVAEQNRITHGRTKAEKDAAKSEKDQAAKHIDGHKLESPDDD